LPAPRFPGPDARAVFWVPATEGGAPAGGWLVLDADGDGVLGAADLVARVGSAASPVALDASDFVPGTFFANEGGQSRAGTAGNDPLIGGTLGEFFTGSGGSDRIEGGAGSANTLGYAGLAGPVAVRFTGHGAGTAAKPGGAADAFTGIHAVSGTGGNDTLDASAAGAGLFAVSLEGGRGNDRIVGDGGHGVQATYAAGASSAVLVDLHAGTATDGWGGTDALVGVRRVAVASAAHDTVLGSAHDDLFLSAGGGNKVFDGRGGSDEYRYAGAGAITVALTPPVFDGLAESAYVLKPDGSTDRLYGIEAVSGGFGADSIVGSAAAERLAGGAGRDTLDGGGGLDTVRYDLLSAGAPLPVRGAAVDLAAGAAVDP
jgi:Ca2+-binding RTX toxin-like protein